MEYTVRPEEDGRKVRDILRRSMGVSYTAMKSAKWNGRIRLNGKDQRGLHIRALTEDLVNQFLREFVSGQFRESGDVLDLRGERDLPADTALLDDEGRLAVSLRVKGRGHTRGPCTDDDYVVHI